MKKTSRVTVLLLAGLSGMTASAAGYDATVMFGRRVELGLPVSGMVKTVNVMTGQNVATGQTLMALDDIPFVARVAQAEAGLARSRADQTVAVRDYQQARQLYERALLSNVELENAKLNAERAEAEFSQAQARLTQAKYELEHSRITAPFDGWVLDVRTRAGESITNTLENRPVLVLAEQAEYVARLQVPASAKLVMGQQAKVFAAGQQFEGRIATTGLEPAHTTSGGPQYEIGVAFNTGKLLLRGGQPARVEFP